MKFQKKILTLFLFVLISIGQAYPFSVAYSIEAKKKPAVCCCHQTEDKCHCPHQHASKKTIQHSCHKDKSSGYQAMCRGKTQDEILSFRTELFLTSQFQSGLLFPNQFYFQSQCFQKEEYSNPPLSPPPRA